MKRKKSSEHFHEYKIQPKKAANSKRYRLPGPADPKAELRIQKRFSMRGQQF